jgi:hypothetical protein
MLAPLGFYLLALLAMCGLSLLIFWLFDLGPTRIEALREGRVMRVFPDHSQSERFDVRIPGLKSPARWADGGRHDRSPAPNRGIASREGDFVIIYLDSLLPGEDLALDNLLDARRFWQSERRRGPCGRPWS